MRHQEQEFADFSFTAQKWSAQCKPAIRSQLEYLYIYREALEDESLVAELMRNSSSKKLTHPHWSVTDFRNFLLRPFRQEDQTIPPEERAKGKRAKGFIVWNIRRKRMFYKWQGEYDLRDTKPQPLFTHPHLS